jgi:Iron-sulfur cluster binding domain of dihydroorotate dehydrogenase B
MRVGTGELIELYLENGLTGGRLLCPQNLIPSPGEYLLAHAPASSAPLSVPVFCADPVPGGFLVAPPIPQTWRPGTILSLRGPLGHGFSLPASVSHVALVALGKTSARLKPLIPVALGQAASIALVSELDLPELPPEVEIQPVSTLPEVAQWADYLAFDLPRESLPGLREKLRLGEHRPCREHVGARRQAKVPFEAQALVVTPMPCGGMAECGLCAVTTRRGWKMACKDGPVFDLGELI